MAGSRKIADVAEVRTRRFGALLAGTALGCTLFAATTAGAQSISQTSATGEPITINSTTASASADGVDAIYAETDGAISVTSGSATASGFEASGIHAQGGAGAITIDSETAAASGSGGPAILATATSGDIAINSSNATQTSTVYDGTWWTGDAISAASDTGSVSVISGTAHSDALYGSAVYAFGGSVSITSETASTSGLDGVAVGARTAAGSTGDATVVSGTISTSAASNTAIEALSEGGAASVTSESIASLGSGTGGIHARGLTGVTVASGAVEVGGYGIYATSAEGEVAITSDTITTLAQGDSAIVVNTTPGNVTVDSGTINAAGWGISVLTGNNVSIASDSVSSVDTSIFAEATGPVTIDSGSVEMEGDYESGIRAVTPGAISITSGSVTVTGPGADPGIDSANGFRVAQGGIVAQGGENAITIDSGSVSVDGNYRYGIFASGNGAITIASDTLEYDAQDSAGIMVVGGAGAVNVDSGTLTANGSSGAGVVVRTTSGVINIIADETHANGTGIFGPYTADAVVGLSDSGAVSIISNNASSDGYAGSAVAAIGSSVTIDSGTAAATGDYGAIVYGSALNGNASVTSDSITSTGLQTNALVSRAVGGTATVNSGTIVSTGAGGMGIFARGDAVDISSASIETDGYGIDAGSTDGDIAIVSGSVATTGDDAHGILAHSNGAISIISEAVSTQGLRAQGIFADGGEGDITIDSGTINVGGNSAPAILAIATSGDILINAEETVNSGGEYDFSGIYTGEGVVGVSETGRVEINSGIARTSAQYGSAIGAQGTEVLINADVTETTGQAGAAMFAMATGNSTVNSGTVTTSGDNTIAITIRSDTGLATLNSGSAVASGANSYGLSAIGATGAAVTSGTIEADGRGLQASASGGNVMIDSGEITTRSAGQEAILVNETGGNVTIASDSIDAAGHGMQVEAAGDIGIDSGSLTVAAGGGYGIHAASNGAITIDSGSVTTAAGEFEGSQNAAIYAAGGEGAINITSGTIESSGAGTSGVYATSTSGDIHITAEDSRSTATDLGPNFTYNDVLVGISQTGDVTIDSGYTESASLYGSGIVGIGQNVLITSDNSVASGDGGVAIYGSGVTGVTIQSNTITTGGNGAAINALAIDGTVDVTSGTISSANGSGIYASGFLGTNVTAGAVATKRTAISLESDGGDIALTTTGAISSSEFSAVYLAAAGTSTVVVDAASTLTAGKIGVFAERGTLHLTNAGTIRSNGTYDGFDEAPHAGVTISQGDAIVTNSGTISGAGFGITTAHYYNPETELLEPNAVGTAITNSGTIQGDANDAIRLIGGGTVTNSGTIAGGDDGISMFGLNGQDRSADTTIGSVDNAVGGSISGTRFGVILTGGGEVTNAGTIAGGAGAVLIQTEEADTAKIATVTNSGTLNGGVILAAHDNSVVNSGTIASGNGAAVAMMDVGSLDNAGTISGTGGIAVQFVETDDALTLRTGSSVTGVIDGGAGVDHATVAGTSATVTNLQTIAETDNFEGLTVESGYWTASTGSSEYDLVGIAAGATLDVHEVAVGGAPSSAIVTEVVHNDGLLVLNFDSDELADIETLAITGSGGVRLDGEAAFTVDEAVMGFTGTTTVANGSLTLAGTGGLSGDVATSGDGAFVLGDGGTTGTFTGDLVNNGVFVFNRTDNYDFMGAFSGTGDFMKMGAGTLTFAGDYSYTGTTTIAGGSVKFAGQLDPETEIDLESGTLDISGTPQTIAQLSGGETAGINVQNSQLTVNQTSNTSFAGSISGDGGLVKSGTGLLNLTGNSTYTGNTVVNGGALAVNGSIASTVVVNPGGTLKGVGTIGGATITSSGTAAPGNSIGTLNVAGDIAFAAGSTYEVEVNAAGESDRIIATGSADISGGTVQVLAADGNYAPLTEYNIITAAGGVEGAFDTVTSNLAFLTPTLTYGATTVGLELLRNDIDFSSVASTDNQRSTADALQALGPRNDLFEAIVVQDEANARSAYDELSGELYASVPSALINDSRHVRDALLGAGRTAGEGNSVWGQALGSWGGSNGGNGIAELDTDHKGMMAGVNFGRDNVSGGIGAGVSKADYDMRDRGSNAEADSKFVGAHIGFGDGPLGLRVGGAYAWHDIDATRTIDFPGVTESPAADYDATTRQLFGEASYDLAYGAAAVSPFARLATIRTSTDGFDESDGDAALTLERDVRNVQLLSLGVRASTVTPISANATIEPRASIAWQHGWGDLGGRSTAAFAGGAGFDVLGARLPEDAADLDVGFDIRSGNFRIGASYRGLVSNRWSDHGAQVTLGFDF